MTDRPQKVTKLIVPLIVLAISQIYVTANSTQPTQNQGARTPAIPMIGRLEVHRGKTIRVDSTDAEDGYTILDGQMLETSSCVSATVHLLPVGSISNSSGGNPALNRVGQIDLATNTKALINYSAGKVQVTLVRGCVRERMSLTIDAIINAPDGSSTAATLPDTINRKRAEVCYPSNNNQEFTPLCVPPVVWIGGASAVATTAVIIGPRGENPSPELPSVP